QEQVFGGKHSYVGWDHVAGRQPDDIARHQHLEWHFSFLTITHQRRRVADHRLELFRSVIGPHLLVETQHHAQNHHHENDRGCPQVTSQKRKHAERREQEDQGILDVTQETHQGRLTL